MDSTIIVSILGGLFMFISAVFLYIGNKQLNRSVSFKNDRESENLAVMTSKELIAQMKLLSDENKLESIRLKELVAQLTTENNKTKVLNEQLVIENKRLENLVAQLSIENEKSKILVDALINRK